MTNPRATETPTTPTVSISDATVTETDAVGRTATFTVSLDRAPEEAVTMDYRFFDDLATNGTDYTATPGTLTFAPGETTKTIEVAITPDISIEPDETFLVGLFNPVNAAFPDGRMSLSAKGTITENDAFNFDAESYLTANPDLAAAGLTTESALSHFLNFGRNEDRMLDFDAAAYLAVNPDLTAAGLTEAQALEHFKLFGQAESRPLSADAYLAANPDLIAAGLTEAQAGEHFVNFGRDEGRLPGFDAAGYLMRNPDLLSAGFNVQQAAEHFQAFGQAENRQFFDENAFTAANPDIATDSLAFFNQLRDSFPTAGLPMAGLPDIAPPRLLSDPDQGDRGQSHGDPHLVSFDGLAYDFMAVGEFKLVTAASDGFEIQVRYEPVEGTSISLTTAIATRVGSARVSFTAGETLTLKVDGATVELADGATQQVGTGAVTRQSNEYTLFFATGDKMIIANNGPGPQFGAFFDVDITLADSRASGSVTGLLGNKDGDPGNDLSLSDGTNLGSTASFEQIHRTLADSWRITQAESLFDYESGQTTDSFTDKSFPATPASTDQLDPQLVQTAQSLATNIGFETGTPAFEAAVLDYAMTGDVSFFTGALRTLDFTALQTLLNNLPGTFDIPTIPSFPEIPGIPGLPFVDTLGTVEAPPFETM
ncbi:MAG: VWD domain-containing protein [Alphaproteobacteria bacterium]|nr:VWD domain-containing protein [Alphaproteobacteria bacterium]